MQIYTPRIINIFLLFSLIVLLTAPAYAASSASAGEADPVALRDFFIAGKVTTPDGKPLENVEVILVGAANRDTLTKADGSYYFDLLRKGAYTVSARRAGMRFMPNKTSVTLNGANWPGINFISTR